MDNILKKTANTHKKHKKQPIVAKTYEEFKQDAIKSSKQFIQNKIDELKTYRGYRDLTKHEQYLLGCHVCSWYEDEEIVLIKDRVDNTTSYVIEIRLWGPGVLTYYVDRELLKDDIYDLSDDDKRLCVLLVDEVRAILQIMSEWQTMQANIKYYDSRIEEGENK